MKPFLTLAQLREGLTKKRFSATELTKYFLDRIERHNAALNCYISVEEESALAEARKADQRLQHADAEKSPLLGIPVTHKDLFCTEGIRTTCGSKMLSTFVAPYDATVVKKLCDAGTVTLGKANMDEFAMGSSNETSYFGPVSNPWELSHSPGGSSGGSAASVASGLTPIATGTDTGGSIRQPSGFCGTTGLKPTYGRVSRFGMIAFASSLDQGGPIAMSAEDCGLLLQAMEGYDPNDSTCAQAPPTDLTDQDRSLVVGVPTELFEDLDQGIGSILDEARNELDRLGHKLVEVDLPHSKIANSTYYVIAGAEASANLSRYDGVRYGHRAETYTDLNDLYQKSRSEGFGPEVKRRILTGTFALSVGYYDAYYLKAQKIRRLVRDDFFNAFKEVDLIFSPVTPTTAFPLGSLADDPVQMYKQDLYTIPASLAGLPALSLPCGFQSGLPVNCQYIGNHFDEATVLYLARQFQAETAWHQEHPVEFNA